jgi:hypothetical protein
MMQVQNQTQQIAEEELLLPLSEDELVIINGGSLWDTVQHAVGWAVDHAPPGPIATPAKLYKASSIHNEEGHWWSFL